MNDKKYTEDHEWIELNNDIATVGITNHAQESLGDIVFVDLPEIGKQVVKKVYGPESMLVSPNSQTSLT